MFSPLINNIARALLPLLFLTVTTHAFAAGDEDYAQGCEQYAKGDFDAARANFGRSAINFPLRWESRYQLANTCLKMNDKEAALKHYQACLTLKPPATIAKNCAQAVQFLGASKVASESAEAAKIREKEKAEKTRQTLSRIAEERQADLAKKVEEQQKVILARAEEEAAQIRAKAKAQAAEAEATGNQYFISRKDGSIYPAAAVGVSERIIREGEQKAAQVLEDARRRASALARTKTDDVSAHISRQIAGNGEFGISEGSGLYVRHYQHRSK